MLNTKHKKTVVTAAALIASMLLASCSGNDFMKKNGLETTHTGDFSFKTGMFDDEGNTGEFTMLCNCQINQKQSDKSGYKIVYSVFSCDPSNSVLTVKDQILIVRTFMPRRF